MDNIKPMLARLAEPFSDKDWIFEVKWDGTRALCFINEHIKFLNRRGVDITYRYPELCNRNDMKTPCVLDGEIVVLKKGKPSFSDLQKREHVDNPFKITLLSEQIPAVYIVFDILQRGTKDLTHTKLHERKILLERTVTESPRLMLCPFVEGKGEAYYEAVVKAGFEGIMAKRRDSLYYPGKRSDTWLKIKKIKTLDCVIGGFTEGEGIREGYFGALLLGVGQPLTYVGKVGTGFTRETVKDMYVLLKRIETDENPFSETIPHGKVHFVTPIYVCEVKYLEMTDDKKLRAPVFLRLRSDKIPEECTLE
jgi:DNA ligase D-like protein (predicted ligase)